MPILKNKNACLMANHGALTIGESIEAAYINSVYLEDAAKIYHLACIAGTPAVLDEKDF